MSDVANLDRIACWLGTEWSEQQRALFIEYGEWLAGEAIDAGGIGPREGERIFDRHIADSLAFALLIPDRASTLVDVGSGVGLPAIPLAIALPELSITIVDRSERRCSLAARALRILGIENVEVRVADVDDLEGTYDVVTFRASLLPPNATRTFVRLTDLSGTGLFALTRRERAPEVPEPPTGVIFSVTSEGVGVLDSPAWILRMQHTRFTEEQTDDVRRHDSCHS